MNNLISIIVPVYNVQDYALNCLDSLKNQKYKEIEIIIVDDGSTDQSGAICDDFVKGEKRAKVFHKQNGGLSSARNFGLKKSKGEIVAFVDSDDYVNENYISDMYEIMLKTRADVVVCGYNSEKPDSAVLSGIEATAKLLTRQLTIDILAWNKLYKKELFLENKIWFPEGQNHEDLLTTYKVFSKAGRVAYIDEPLYEYVERKESITGREKVIERLEKRAQAAEEAIDYLKDNSDLVAAAQVALLLAKYAFVDFAISGRIAKKEGKLAREWILNHKDKYKNNKYVSRKLKIYNALVSFRDGELYTAFRKIRHE